MTILLYLVAVLVVLLLVLLVAWMGMRVWAECPLNPEVRRQRAEYEKRHAEFEEQLAQVREKIERGARRTSGRIV